MQEIIKNLIKEAIGAIGISEKDIPAFSLEHPEIMAHGDFATNVALILAKQLKKSPVEVARQIVEKISQNKPAEISKVEVAGPGFINFYLSDKYFVGGLKDILETSEKYGQNDLLKKEKMIVEYTDPNPFKDFHIGHLMTNTIGESLSRILEADGAEVKRANYQGDVGLHVAKAIYGAKKMMKNDSAVRKEFFGGLFGLGKNPKVWGKAYAMGAGAYESYGPAKKEITDLNKAIYDRSDKEVNKIYDVGRKVSLAEFEKIYKTLGTKFDYYFFESEVGDLGKEIVEKGLTEGYFEKSDGAVIFKGEKYDPSLHTRVFINSQGLPTYEAKELGLAKEKYCRFAFDKTIAVTGNEINDYYRVVKKAMELVMPDLAQKVIHIGHGMLRLPSGKMSSRTGQVITGESLLLEIKNNVLEKMKDRPMPAKEKAQVAEIVAVGALKYSILKQVAGKDIVFDFDKSLSFEGDSGPYLQYACVRAKSILEKAKKEGIKADINSGKEIKANDFSKLLIRFPEIVERAGREYSPHYLATYLTELAAAFSAFYATETVVDKNDTNSPYKVALTEAFFTVMKNGLNLLGIKVPDKM
jgi:arginyl-tRNA synthetase